LTNWFFNLHDERVGVGVDVLQPGDRLRGSLSPLRRSVLAALREPSSATTVAARLGESRQRVNYHLRELEKAGLVELVEVRQRRGCAERVVRASADAVVVAPAVVGELADAAQDRFAVESLLASAARTFEDVAPMREEAAAAGTRLITFTVEADVGFRRPADIERFAGRLAAEVAALVAEFDAPGAARRYRIAVGGHPVRRAGSADAMKAAAMKEEDEGA
jgi:DNA-binding transcriptional ArsR family regulator